MCITGVLFGSEPMKTRTEKSQWLLFAEYPLCVRYHVCLLSFLGKRFIYFYVQSEFCLHVCMRIICVPGVHGGQKTVSNTLEMELQRVVSHHVCALGIEP